MSKLLERIGSQANKPKFKLGMGLAVAALAMIAPKESKSVNYCNYGQKGDCDLDTNGDTRCIVTNFLGDCS